MKELEVQAARRPRFFVSALLLAAGLVAFPAILVPWLYLSRREAGEEPRQAALVPESGDLVWYDFLPRPPRAQSSVSWRATVETSLPGRSIARQLADSGTVESRWYANHPVELARFPDTGKAMLLKTTLRADGEVLERWQSFVPPTPPNAEELEKAGEAAKEEAVVAAKYGVVWPEGSYLATYEKPEMDHALLYAKRALGERFLSMRDDDQSWLPLPSRSMARLSVQDGVLYRQVWHPLAGDVTEPVWIARQSGPVPDEAEAARLNLHPLVWSNSPIQGLWTPFPIGDFHESLQRIQFERIAPFLVGYRFRERIEAGQFGIRAESETNLQLHLSGVDVFHNEAGEELGLVYIRAGFENDAGLLEHLPVPVPGLLLTGNHSPLQVIAPKIFEAPGLALFKLQREDGAIDSRAGRPRHPG